VRESCEDMAVTLAQRSGTASEATAARTPRMEKFVIDGGVPLSGTIVPAGNKNGALPCLAATVLTEDEVVVRNIPRIRDVEAMLALLEHLGATVDWRGEHEVAICAAGITADATVDTGLAEAIRASFLLAGPLLARFGRAAMPAPGGDVIGRRRLDPHLDAFSALGATDSTDALGTIRLEAPSQPGDPRPRLRAGEVFMDEPSVMATENALLAAALTPGETRIGNAACEPHVVDLARMLVKMGATIRGIGSNVLFVTGAAELGGTTHDIGPDHIEIGSFMAIAGVTGGEIRIKDTEPEDLRMIRLVFRRIGLETVLDGADVLVPGGQKLVVQRDLGDHMCKVQDGPWPAFPADLTSIAVALATQSEGEVLVHEWMFESRLFFCDKLISMGANILIADVHRALVAGPRRMRGARVESPDIRAGMAVLLAALCAEGRTEIGNIRQIDRGYERIDERLRDLGARIERVAEQPALA
jgi:UDP-N-acetylglucosamine 1-carboxyvinyltransferase